MVYYDCRQSLKYLVYLVITILQKTIFTLSVGLQQRHKLVLRYSLNFFPKKGPWKRLACKNGFKYFSIEALD